MNLWFRIIWLLIASRFRPRLKPPRETSVVSLIVLPNDLDIYGHMNNGRYLTIMDLGRLDLFLRGGLVQAIKGARWNPVLSAAKVRYRRELRLWQKFRLETRIVYWAQTTFVVEHRIVTRIEGGREVVATQALMRGGLYDRKARAFVPVAELFTRMNIDTRSPELTDDVRAFLEAEEALKRAA